MVSGLMAALLCAGCAPSSGWQSNQEHAAWKSDRIATSRIAVLQRELATAEKRVRELEGELADRDRQIAAGRDHDPSASPAMLASTGDAASAPAAGSGAATSHGSAARSPAAGAASPAASPGRSDAAVPAAPYGGSTADLHVQRQIAGLEERLSAERRQREMVEAALARLLEETSAGPYEKSEAVERHLRRQLAGAREELAALQATLANQRRDRAALEERFNALRAEVERTAAAQDDGEVAALAERQRRALASLEQELDASRRRERELRATVESSQGNGATLAEEVISLRARTATLQRELDEQHQQNRQLSAKLQVASRVTELIFKMRANGVEGAPPAPVR
ncbi:MAG: hypothetical protein AB7P78_13695 [Candidatus Binatia bacterium]